MSNATIIQTNTDIFIGSDTATSVVVEDELFRLNEKANKLFNIDNYVIFLSGDLDFCYRVINIFKDCKERDLISLKNIVERNYRNESIDLIVCEYDEGKTKVHQISPYNNFEITSFYDIPVDSVNILTSGMKTVESYNIARDSLYKGIPVSSLFSNVFNNISYEGIGGSLNVYRINKDGIQLFIEELQIKEPYNLKRFNISVAEKIFSKHLIVGERIYGKVIMGVNLAIEDENGIVKWQGSKGEIFDRNGKLVMKMGLVEEVGEGLCGESFGLISFNDITKVKLTDCEGITVERKENDGWRKVLWANTDGTLYTHDLVAENIKIVNNVGKEILNAETYYFDIGDFQKIVMDNKLTTLEKMQLITELNRIHSGYKLLLSQADEYMRVHRDDIIDVEGAFNVNTQRLPSTPSTKDRYSTDPLANAYADLINYMSSYIKIIDKGIGATPLKIDVNDPLTESTSEVPDRAEFINMFKNYYDEAEKLRQAIEDTLFYAGINMGEYHNNMVLGEFGLIVMRNDGRYRAFLNATNGLALQKWENNRWTNKVYASIGNSDYEDGTLIAEDLVAKRLRIETRDDRVLLDSFSLNFDFTVLEAIIYDDIIMSPEKSTLQTQFAYMTEQKNKLKEQISRYSNTIYSDRDNSYYGLDQARSNLLSAESELDSSYSNLKSTLDLVFENMNEKTVISTDLGMTKAEFNSLFRVFYEKYESVRSRLEDFLEKSSLQLGRNYNNTVIDAENGVVVTRGDNRVRTVLNATEGIYIETDSGGGMTKKFYVDTDGVLYANELHTTKLRILDGNLGDAIILDALTGITINGQNGEQIRINANEGFAIDVNGEERMWIGTDGTLRARKLIVHDQDDGSLPPLDQITGSYISDLTVRSLRSLSQAGTHDHLFIHENYLKIFHGNGGAGDVLKFALTLTGNPSYPIMQWGLGSGGGREIGWIYKNNDEFKFQYYDQSSRESHLNFHRDGTGTLKSNKVRIEVDGSNYIEITPAGVVIKGSKIELN